MTSSLTCVVSISCVFFKRTLFPHLAFIFKSFFTTVFFGMRSIKQDSYWICFENILYNCQHMLIIVVTYVQTVLHITYIFELVTYMMTCYFCSNLCVYQLNVMTTYVYSNFCFVSIYVYVCMIDFVSVNLYLIYVQ